MADKYNKYFSIDEEYFPTINAGIMQKKPELWKKFYPHESFVNFLKTTIKSLAGEGTHRSIWLHGAYGTGKSHAVLTLKRLIDSSREDAREYFDRFPNELSKDLFNRLDGVKTRGKILTVYRDSSSSITNDSELVAAIQTSISQALDAAGMEHEGDFSDAILNWLKGSERQYFSSLIRGEYSQLFGNQSVDEIEAKLRVEGTSKEKQTLINQIIRVGREKSIKTFAMDIDSLKSWIRSVIDRNDLHAVLFIWDEFSEYLLNNRQSLSGFQSLLQFSGEEPFYMVVVAHVAKHYFGERDNGRKIFDRFEPTCEIKLPESIAFKLLGESMTRTRDLAAREELKGCFASLQARTHDSRAFVSNEINIEDDLLRGIFPLHPYTALLLNAIASCFTSNQRSIFEFIQNSDDEKFEGFHWYINQYGPLDDDPLFMPDMLWNYFYVKGKQDLVQVMRNILDYYDLTLSEHDLDEDSQRVLRAILLMQAIYASTAAARFMPNEKMIKLAFEGSDRLGTKCMAVVAKLVEQKILYKSESARHGDMYNIMTRAQDSDAMKKVEDAIRLRTDTTDLIDIESVLKTPARIANRFSIKAASATKLRSMIGSAMLANASDPSKYEVIVAFAKTDEESNQIREIINDPNVDLGRSIVVDATSRPLRSHQFDLWVKEQANAQFFKSKNPSQAESHDRIAKEFIANWYEEIGSGDFIVYRSTPSDAKARTKVTTREQMFTELQSIARDKYRDALDLNFRASDTLWQCSAIKQGVRCAVSMKLSGCYTSRADAMRIDVQAGKLWYDDESAWMKSGDTPCENVLIEMRKAIDAHIEREFTDHGRVSIRSIYEVLEGEPFGIRPCNMTAFVLGLLLRRFAQPSYLVSNDVTSDPMSEEQLADIIDGVIKLKNDNDTRYKDKYIVRDKMEIRFFCEEMAKLFARNGESYDSVDNARMNMRQATKGLLAPIWMVKEITSTEKIRSSEKTVGELVDLMTEFLNIDPNHVESESDIAIRIGKQSHESVAIEDLKYLFKPAQMRKAVVKYATEYRGGRLVEIAEKVGDTKTGFVDEFKKRFSKTEGNWVWGREAVEGILDDLIREYEIADLSSAVVPNEYEFDKVCEGWREKFRSLRIPYMGLKSIVDDDLYELLTIFYDLFQPQVHLDAEKCDKWIKLLKDCESDLREFFKPEYQMNAFAQIVQFDTHGIDDCIEDVFQEIERDQWCVPRADYVSKCEGIIAAYMKASALEELKDLWREKTCTESPRDWSNRYQMPILSMFRNDEQTEAESQFAIINGDVMRDETAIRAAIHYIEEGDFFDRLASEKEREAVFEATFMETGASLVSVDELCEAMRSTGEEPYYWHVKPSARDAVTRTIKKAYAERGKDMALKKIDAMSLERLREYLRDLVADNYNVGLAIINDKQ